MKKIAPKSNKAGLCTVDKCDGKKCSNENWCTIKKSKYEDDWGDIMEDCNKKSGVLTTIFENTSRTDTIKTEVPCYIQCNMDETWVDAASKDLNQDFINEDFKSGCDGPYEDGSYTCFFPLAVDRCQDLSNSGYVTEVKSIDSITCNGFKCVSNTITTTKKKKEKENTKKNLCTKDRCSFDCANGMCIVAKSKNKNLNVWKQLQSDCNPINQTTELHILTKVPCTAK